MRVGIIGGGFGLAVQAPIINTHPKMNVSAISTMIRHQVPKKFINCRRFSSSLYRLDQNVRFRRVGPCIC